MVHGRPGHGISHFGELLLQKPKIRLIGARFENMFFSKKGTVSKGRVSGHPGHPLHNTVNLKLDHLVEDRICYCNRNSHISVMTCNCVVGKKVTSCYLRQVGDAFTLLFCCLLTEYSESVWINLHNFCKGIGGSCNKKWLDFRWPMCVCTHELVMHVSCRYLHSQAYAPGLLGRIFDDLIKPVSNVRPYVSPQSFFNFLACR